MECTLESWIHPCLVESSFVQTQAIEIDRALDFLQKLSIGKDEWTMCYPYGGFNDSLLQILRARQCRLGFTWTRVLRIWTFDDRLTLPRVDTNEFAELAH